MNDGIKSKTNLFNNRLSGHLFNFKFKENTEKRTKSQRKINKSNIFVKADIECQSNIKTPQANTNSFQILFNESNKLSFKDLTNETKNNNTPTTVYSQSLTSTRFKQKVLQTKDHRVKDSILFKSCRIPNQQSIRCNQQKQFICQKSRDNSKLQFKQQKNFVGFNNQAKSKQCIQQALKDMAKQPITKIDSNSQINLNQGRLNKYRNKPNKDFSQYFEDKLKNNQFITVSGLSGAQNKNQNKLKLLNQKSLVQISQISNNNQNDKKLLDKSTQNKVSNIYQNTSSTQNNEHGIFSWRRISGLKKRMPLSVVKQKIKLTDYRIGRKLGKGKFGDVFLVQDIKTNFICAMKVIKKKILIDQKFDHQFLRELKIQSQMNHPNIINHYGFFDDETNFYLLLEYCADGDLFNLLKQNKRVQESQSQNIIKQICQGVQYIHNKRIIHRDLKPQNILFQMGVPKICDFGWAIHRADTLRDTFCGTPLYISPQILIGQKYDQSVDLWAIGILSYEILIGKTPFKIRCQSDLMKIVNQQIKFPNYIFLSSNCKDFILKTLQRNPSQRCDIEDLLNHEFLKSATRHSFP